ncbi:hypothetical protein BP6252_11029 [Coleophoma cylindrospora]|uniref:AB hydrolase-1 domain-containing protein n=1 Tax=Coleophoma cylindrospora TaxID=1849047 RepID=A0A3D8QPU9_9HELO|nr:hypothetical protein BP6252_11029 [Coleophoma cylindrospora]
MHLAIKQYKPLSNPEPQPGDITIIATHGSGLPKELYEPMFEEIVRKSESSQFKIRSIWFADASHQGASGVLNEEKMGNDPSWFDHSRDLFQMVNHFSADMPRPLVGIGHSMGGAQLMHLAMIHPRLFRSMVLLEPITGKCIITCSGVTLTKLSTFRRDLWSSRAEASMAARKTYKSWDSRVLDRWCEYGLRALPTVIYPEAPKDATDAVTLTTTKHQEVMSYLRPNFRGMVALGESRSDRLTRLTSPDLIGPPETIYPFYRAEPVIIHQALESLRPSICYVFGSESPVSHPKMREEKLQRTGAGPGGSGGIEEGRVAEVLLNGHGHLIPMEAIEQCADAVANWLDSEVDVWRQEDEVTATGWTKKSQREKSMVSQEWILNLKSPQSKI